MFPTLPPEQIARIGHHERRRTTSLPDLLQAPSNAAARQEALYNHQPMNTPA
jgi:hypothetical protein